MSDQINLDGPAIDQPLEDPQPQPFQITVANRVDRLPPYMFGRINAMLYQKRRDGCDVIDMGMGNPSDPPEGDVVEKLSEAASDVRNHGYSKSNGLLNLRREVASKYYRKYGVRLDPDHEIISCLGSKEGFLPHVPRVNGAWRHRDDSLTVFPNSHVCCDPGIGKRSHARSLRPRTVLATCGIYVRAFHAATKDADRQLSAQSVVSNHRTGVLCRGCAIGKEVRLHGHS